MDDRWMIRKDVARVLEIENESFEYPWNEQQVVDFLRVRNQICRLMTINDLVVGYLFYSIHKDSFGVENIAVAKEYRRLGVGSGLVWRLVSRLHSERRSHVHCIVRESNLPAQQFFRGIGFLATSVVKNPFSNIEEDAYSMRFDIAEQTTKIPFSSRFSMRAGD